jgi:hypothetical protein
MTKQSISKIFNTAEGDIECQVTVFESSVYVYIGTGEFNNLMYGSVSKYGVSINDITSGIKQ